MLRRYKKARLNIKIRRSHTGGVATPPGFAKPVAGWSHQKGSGLPILPRASYQTYLEGGGRPGTSRPRLQDDKKSKLKRGAPMETPPVEPLQISASASKGALTRSGLTCTSFFPAVLPSFLPSFLPYLLTLVLHFLPSFLPYFVYFFLE